jgi:signal transduction histidine kinase/CheY-like chemotaxis protein
VSEKPQIEGRPVKILVVDDEEIVLLFVRDALEDIGYQVELSGNGLDALDKIEREYFDFILTDIRMPDCNGLELARKARELLPSVGVIFMTGYANLNNAKDAIKEGAYDYIMKPFELNEIRQAVKNAVRKKGKDTEKTITNELNRLSDLNQLMYTVSDRKSLMRLSLGFALMQGKTGFGSVIFKSDKEGEFGAITTGDRGDNNFEESFDVFNRDYFDFDNQALNAPFVIGSLEEHPLYQAFGDREVGRFLIPRWFKEGYRLVNIALKRGPKLYGFLVLGYPRESEAIKDSELKLLGITASQIAISLENIILLEESRNAYSRLKDLQEQTIQLEKMATRGQMSAEIGHELNNFLGVVMANLSLMQVHLEKKNYDELGKYLKAIISNLDSIKKFTDGLADFSKIESSFQQCDINALISDVIDYLKAQSQFQGIEVGFERSESDIYSIADTGQMQQLFYNLLNNAANAIRENDNAEAKRITVTTKYNPEGGQYSLIVSDTGIGMDQRLLEKAFKERFTTKKSGHGFGLLVCKRIVENHAGELVVDSKPGQGTTVTISFPVKTGPDVEVSHTPNYPVTETTN